MSDLDTAVDFLTTPESLLKPQVTAEIDRRYAARSLLYQNRQRLCLLGLASADDSGNADVLDLRRIFSDADAAFEFGYGSELHLMAKAALSANPRVELLAMEVSAAAGAVAADGSATFSTGASGGDGYGTFTIGNETFTWDIDDGDTAVEICSNLVVAINGKPDLPVSASEASGEFYIEAKCKSAQENEIPWEVSVTATGAAVTQHSTTLANGANDPDYSDGLTAIAAPGESYQPTQVVIAHNTETALGKLSDHCTALEAPTVMNYIHGHVGFDGTVTSAIDLASATNDWWVQVHALEGTKSHSWEVGAAVAAVICSEEDPARPLQTLPVNGIAPPAISDRYLNSEIETMLANGVAPLEVGPGEKVQIVRVVTTYTRTAAGAPDISGLDYNTPETMAYVARDLVAAEKREFPRAKVTTRTEKAVASLIKNRLRLMEEAEIVENVDTVADAILVTRDLDNPGRLNTRIPTDIVVGLRQICNLLVLYLDL